MRARLVSISFALSMASAVPLACSAGGDKDGGPSGLASGGDAGGLLADGGGLNAEAGDDDAACASATYTGKKIPASLLILLDRSASMRDGSKWSSAVSALKSALSKSDDELPVGLLYFPEGKFKLNPFCITSPTTAGCPAQLADNGCKDIKTTPDVPVDVLKTTRSIIESSLSATSPDGDTTPTRWALKNSWAYMQKLAAKSDRYVVLVTDGEPTTYTPAGFGLPEMGLECKDQATIESETLAASTGTPAVKTFVIGAPGSEKAAPHLSRIAVNGKTRRTPTCDPGKGECHYQIGSSSFETDLAKALEEITGKIATCIFEVPTGTDVDPNRVNVSVESSGKTTDAYRDSSHADGWDYTDDTKTRVEVFGPLCDEIKANPSTVSVKILLGCKTRVK